LFKDDLIKFETKGNKKNPSRDLLAYFKYIQSDGKIAYQRHNKAEIERKKSDNKKGFIDILHYTIFCHTLINGKFIFSTYIF
jgi:hypothetical protein